MTSFDDLKAEGNRCFVEGNYVRAVEVYSTALETFEANAIILTNRSAAYIQLGKYYEGLVDATTAIELDCTWTKAYYRKASALEALGRFGEIYLCWQDAWKKCEHTSWLVNQVNSHKLKWLAVFRVEPIYSTEDLLARYQLLTNPRERLSTLAHFWNDSSPEERLAHLHYFFTLIGGQSEQSDITKSITAEMMMPLPLHNYPDFPRTAISQWCDFFLHQSGEEKTKILGSIWPLLTPEQQHLVIVDLHEFFSEDVQNKRESPADDAET